LPPLALAVLPLALPEAFEPLLEEALPEPPQPAKAVAVIMPANKMARTFFIGISLFQKNFILNGANCTNALMFHYINDIKNGSKFQPLLYFFHKTLNWRCNFSQFNVKKTLFCLYAQIEALLFVKNNEYLIVQSA
jgi:hypothetical protein